jgi:hypothetical protein
VEADAIAARDDWKTTASVLLALRVKNAANMTDKQRRVVEEFWEIVTAWDAGEMPIEDATKLTGDGWLRCMALSYSTLDAQDPLYRAAMRMLDEIISRRDDGWFYTNQGWLSLHEIDAAGGRLVDGVDVATGELTRKIQFPQDVDEMTGRIVWPDRREQAAEQSYVSPCREDWFDE